METAADSTIVARAQYLSWLRNTYPEAYAEAIGRAGLESTGLSGFLDSITGAFGKVVKSVTDSLPSLANTYAEYRTAEQLIKLNSERAKQGLPPLIRDSSGSLTPAYDMGYSAGDFSLASTGLSPTHLLMIAAGVGLLIYAVARR